MDDHSWQIGDYILNRRIGIGGMAEVWAAERTVEGTDARKVVAIKLLNAVSRENPDYRRMFLDEARLSMALNNSSIVQVFDAGESNGECYMVMEWIDGLNLSELNNQLWERGERLPLHIAVYIVGEVLRALDHAHNVEFGGASAIVHRDVSPQNVMLSAAGEVKLMDFGVARFSTEETAGIHVKGKLRYMPPEQVQGQSKATTVDLFAAGAVLHEMLEGQRFRDSWDGPQLLMKIIEGAVPELSRPNDFPPQVVSVMQQLLNPDPTRRCSSAREAMRALHQWPGYRNAALDLEAYVARFKDLVPRPPPPSHATTANRRLSHAGQDHTGPGIPDGSASTPGWRGVNPSTSPTLTPFGAGVHDDTGLNVSRDRTQIRRRRLGAVAAAMIGLLGIVGTMWWAIEMSTSPDEVVATSDADPEPVDPRPDAEPVLDDAVTVIDAVQPDEAKAPEAPATTDTNPATPPPPADKGADAGATATDVTGGDDGGESERPPDTVDTSDPGEPEPEPTTKPPPRVRQPVSVTITVGAFRFVYVKLNRKDYGVVSVTKTIELREGSYRVSIRKKETDDWQEIGKVRFSGAEKFQLAMQPPASVKAIPID